VCLVYTTKSIPTFSILLSLLSRPCVSSVAKLSVFGVDRCLSASVSMVEDGSTLAMAFNRSSTVIYTKQYTLASEHICTCSSWVMQNPIISCQVLSFWYGLTQVVLEKRPLNGCSVVVIMDYTTFQTKKRQVLQLRQSHYTQSCQKLQSTKYSYIHHQS